MAMLNMGLVTKVFLASFWLLVSCAGMKKPSVTEPQITQNTEKQTTESKDSNIKNSVVEKKNVLPNGEWIMAKYVQAIGGEAAHKKITSRITTCEMVIDEIGIGAKFTITQKTPNLFLTKVSSEVMGEMSDGYDGSIVWEKSALTGVSILNGVEKLESIRDGDIHADINWKKYYESAVTLAKEDFNGVAVYKVSLKSLSGAEDLYYIDADTFYLLRKEATTVSEGKSEKIAFEFSDFRNVDGIVMPFAAMNETDEMKFNMQCDNVLHNQEVADSFFKLPSDVQATLKNIESKPSEKNFEQ